MALDQVAIDSELKESMRKDAQKYALRLGLRRLSFNQFIAMLYKYWQETSDQEG